MTKPRRKTEYERILKTVGDRMKAARELCGLSQQDAADLLGYKNSSKLAKVEGDIDSISLPLIERAAKVYNVSIDFLFGATDCWERSPTAAQERYVNKVLEAAQEAQNAAIKALSDKQTELEQSINKFMARAKENLGCITRVQELNPEFEELRGGAKLLRLLAETAEEAMGLDYELRKLREAELVIDEVLQDPRHAAVDPKHPDHACAKQALDELRSNIDETRTNFEARRYFLNKCY